MPAWQRPDWTDPTGHQNALAGLPLSQWRWQWIRRHVDYERDFRDLQAIGTQEVLLSADGQSMNPETWVRTRLKRAAGTREKYGLVWMLDPAVDWAPPAVTGRPTVALHLPLDLNRLQAQHDDGYVVLAVDLTGTETDIIAGVKQIVDDEKAAREIAKVVRRQEWITYARVLDAYASLGADDSGKEAKLIADILGADEKEIRLWRNRGLDLQLAAIMPTSK